jgi:hypothetical protein
MGSDEDAKLMYLYYLIAAAVFAVVLYFFLWNSLTGRRILRACGVRTNVRGKSHSGAAGGYGASNQDKRRG